MRARACVCVCVCVIIIIISSILPAEGMWTIWPAEESVAGSVFGPGWLACLEWGLEGGVGFWVCADCCLYVLR